MSDRPTTNIYSITFCCEVYGGKKNVQSMSNGRSLAPAVVTFFEQCTQAWAVSRARTNRGEGEIAEP